jgi:hypothetical protein
MWTSRITGENWHDKRKRSTLMRRYQTETMASRFAVPTGTVVQCAQGQPKGGGKDVFVHIFGSGALRPQRAQ